MQNCQNREKLFGWDGETTGNYTGTIDFSWIINDLDKCCAYRPNSLTWSGKSTLCSGLILETVEPARQVLNIKKKKGHNFMGIGDTSCESEPVSNSPVNQKEKEKELVWASLL